MSERVEITKKFVTPAKNCRFLSSKTCEQLGECGDAFALRQEINYRLEGKDSSLDYQLRESKCLHPQAVEMREVGSDLVSK